MAAIGPETIISKLCFAIHGRNRESDLTMLRRELNKFAREKTNEGEAAPTRQAISKWFKNAIPTSPEAQRFLKEFAEAAINDEEFYVSITQEQKKVLVQIFRESKRKQERNVREKIIHGNSAGHVLIHQEKVYPKKEYLDEASYYEGYYNVFRYKFGSDASNILSREVVRITRIGTHLYVKWWYLIDDKRLESYEGVLLLANQILWMHLFSASLHGRFRTFVANKAKWGKSDDRFNLGLLTSTTPDPINPNPVSCRTVLEKIDEPDLGTEIRKYVFHTSRAEFSHPDKELILNRISNLTSPETWNFQTSSV